MAENVIAFDFIIIGGGTSGLVVANRFLEDPTVNVLVLESGKNYLGNPRVNMPAGWPALLGTEADWNFVTTPQAAVERLGLLNNYSANIPSSGPIQASFPAAPENQFLKLWNETFKTLAMALMVTFLTALHLDYTQILLPLIQTLNNEGMQRMLNMSLSFT
ncbi:hypothetical protein BPAE_0068g00180 [Botrytis paeoniae]|uniref:Uncharacterized protein n=1 Tax=Botrytis paeoniae TaxID=278948 RepID=A0A4Z1FMA6_9HELO|nr:hypothetical protein BPAE_0068g00180 [Botrytis paeoniae]